MEPERPKVGVGVIVRRGDMILLGKRKNKHGAQTWSFPGGHLEMFESIIDCGVRETLEETGLTVSVVSQGPYTNDFFDKDGKHYVTLYVIADYIGGEPQLLEPDRCEEWKWFAWDTLPEPLFIPLVNLKKSGYDPFA
jgi:8-oxo-dGTP diphosphatase